MTDSFRSALPISASSRTFGRARVGVVLAAGRSERLRRVTRGRSKLLLHLGGLRLIERAVRTMLGAGVDRVVVVVGHQATAVASAIEALDGERVQVVRADRWEAGNGASLAAAEAAVGSEDLFLLLCGDHVFAEGALDELASAGEPAVLVDHGPDGEAWEEGTRVLIEAGRVVAFGKSLDAADIDCGAFVLTPEVFACQRAASAEGDDTLAGAVTRLAAARRVRAVSLPAEDWWQDIDTPHDLRRARGRLRRSLGLEHDGPVARYLNRPISTRLSMLLSPLRPSPNLLSFVAFALGTLAAFFLGVERPLMGGILVQASAVVGGMDGEAARLQLRESPRGEWLNGAINRMVDAAVVVGLAIWVAQRTFSSRSVLLLVAGVGITWALLAMFGRGRVTLLGLPPSTERLVGFSLGGRDGRLFLVTAWAVLGHPMVALTAFLAAWAVAVTVRLFLVGRDVDYETPTGLT